MALTGHPEDIPYLTNPRSGSFCQRRPKMTDHLTEITIRRLDETDAAALARLAELDSAPVPQDHMLAAEAEGRLLAAMSLTDGSIISDPFSRTLEARALLELRAAQLRRAEAPRRRRPTQRRTRSRAALAGSVPGAGGRLLTL
jgi:hypothetical protein